MRIEGLKGRGLRSLRALALLPGSLRAVLRHPPPDEAGPGHRRRRLQLGARSCSWPPRLGIPTLILEQNARPGFTNRLLARWVRKAVVAFESSLPYFRGKGVCLGNPVREEFYGLPAKARDAEPGRPRLRRQPGFALPQREDDGGPAAPRAGQGAVPHRPPDRAEGLGAASPRAIGPAASTPERVAPLHRGHGLGLRPGRPRPLPGRRDDAGRAHRRAEGLAPRPLRRRVRRPSVRERRGLVEAVGGAEVVPESRLTPEVLAGRTLPLPEPPGRASTSWRGTSSPSASRTRPATDRRPLPVAHGSGRPGR